MPVFLIMPLFCLVFNNFSVTSEIYIYLKLTFKVFYHLPFSYFYTQISIYMNICGILSIYSLFSLCVPRSLMISVFVHICPLSGKPASPSPVPFIPSLLNHPSVLVWTKCLCFVLPQFLLLIPMLGLIHSSTQLY